MDRTKYIGSSDARKILYEDWGKLWEIKTGRAERENLDDVFRVQLGNVTEPFHLDWTCRRLRESGSPWIASDEAPEYRHPTMPFVLSHPDRTLIRNDDYGDKAPVEAKFGNRGYMNADQLADFYMSQMQHHLFCMGAQEGLFSFSLDRDEPIRLWVDASPSWHVAMEEAYREFWGYVERDERPPRRDSSLAQTKGLRAASVPMGEEGKVKTVIRDATGDNEWTDLAMTYAETIDASLKCEKAKKALKELMRPTDREVVLPGILRVRRTGSGVRFYPDKPAADVAAE